MVSLIGMKYVTSTIYGQFKILDPSNSKSEVDVTIDYDISWRGVWTLSGVFTDYNDAKAEVIVYLYDVTNGSRVVKKTEPPVHTMKTDGFIGIDIVDVGVGQDIGSTTNSMSAKLTRGHTYRVALTLHITGKGLANATISLDYGPGLGDGGLRWNDFTVAVSRDVNERIDLLEERVVQLEGEIAQLRSDLRNHTHIYLTGRGEGHNNVEARTSPAIIMEDSSLTDDELIWLPVDDSEREPLPARSVLLTNYPNPFNPATTISFSLPEASQARIVVYNSLGQEVALLLDEYRDAGEHKITFDAKDLATGVYFYRLTTPRYVETRKLMLLK